ncbi:MAG TPA: TonB-dependent receptor, partial [Longimicrobiaceae bacterium]|nr:TonB-dependent receptor [Longimicrobiaceae bacterium]
LVVQRIGYAEVRIPVTLPAAAPVEVTLGAKAVALEPLLVQPSSFGDDPARAGVSITPLEAVTTPGSAGDIYRALQTFPGVTSVNETAGLYVRGGDVSETKVLLDGAVVLSPYRLDTPTGAAFGTFDPFLLNGVFFSSGGFGARYGDAMSGLVALETVGRPQRTSVSASASVAALSGSLALALPKSLGVRATATRTSTALLFRLNGRGGFDVAPEGRDLSASMAWSPRPQRQIKVFALDQWDRVVGATDTSVYHSAFTSDHSTGLMVLSGKDVWGAWSPSFAVSTSKSTQREKYRAYELDRRERYVQARAEMAWQPAALVTLRLGGEVERRTSRFDGYVPASNDDEAPGAPTRFLGSKVTGNRTGTWLESEWHPADRLQVTAGLRTDYPGLTRVRTWDPRLSGALALGGKAALTFAWGRYHQAPGPLAYDSTIGKPGIPSMRAEHLIGGVVLGDAAGKGRLLRVEAYQKRYRQLAQLGRGYGLTAGGTGTTRGMDVFLRWSLPAKLDARISYSLLHARRTDPNTGVMAPSEFDVRHSAVAVVEREWKGRWRVGGTWRWSTGAPFTDVVGAVQTGDHWTPVYGAPNAERLPAFQRLDLSGNWLHSFWRGNLSAVYVSLSNALGRENVSGYSYNQDYSRRVPAKSLFRRTLYFGFSSTTNW